MVGALDCCWEFVAIAPEGFMGAACDEGWLVDEGSWRGADVLLFSFEFS